MWSCHYLSYLSFQFEHGESPAGALHQATGLPNDHGARTGTGLSPSLKAIPILLTYNTHLFPFTFSVSPRSQLRAFVVLKEQPLAKCALGVSQAIESAVINVQWTERNSKSISKVLKIFTDTKKDI